jgi:hypothetical protein
MADSSPGEGAVINGRSVLIAGMSTDECREKLRRAIRPWSVQSSDDNVFSEAAIKSHNEQCCRAQAVRRARGANAGEHRPDSAVTYSVSVAQRLPPDAIWCFCFQDCSSPVLRSASLIGQPWDTICSTVLRTRSHRGLL